MKSIAEHSKKKNIVHTVYSYSFGRIFSQYVHKNRWVHHSKSFDNFVNCTCGKYAYHEHIKFTSNLNDVTCQRCIEKLKENNWYCEKCGFIDGKNVTYDETCELCGEKL